jgi:hypothetical protein
MTIDAHTSLYEKRSTLGELGDACRLASGFRLAAARLDRLDTKSAFDLEE